MMLTAQFSESGGWWTGAAKGYTDVVAVTLGTGVGGGIITGGRLLEGTKGFAGEIGHFPTHAGEKECICGMKGCFERYASTSALIREAGKIDPEWSSGRILFGAAAEGKTDALKLIGAWIDEVAYGIAFKHEFLKYSFSVAEEKGVDAEKVYHLADERMYEDKKKYYGRR